MVSTLPLSALFHLQADVTERLFASRAQHVLAITYVLNQGSAVRACTGVRHYDLIYFLRSAVLKDSIYSIIWSTFQVPTIFAIWLCTAPWPLTMPAKVSDFIWLLAWHTLDLNIALYPILNNDLALALRTLFYFLLIYCELLKDLFVQFIFLFDG